MNPAKTSATRERQSLRCCGVLYARWRFTGKKFPGTHHEVCVICRCHLKWHQFKPVDRRRVDRERQLDRRVNFKLAGRRSDGRPRTRVFLSAAQDRQKHLERYHARARARTARNLTTRGTRRVYRPRAAASATAAAWTELRASMTIPRHEFLSLAERGE